MARDWSGDRIPLPPFNLSLPPFNLNSTSFECVFLPLFNLNLTSASSGICNHGLDTTVYTLSVAPPAEPRGEKKLFFVQILGGEKLLKFGEKWAVKNFSRPERG